VPLISAIGTPVPLEDCPDELLPCPELEPPPCPELEPPPCPELEPPPCPELEPPPCPELEPPPPPGPVTVRSLLARITDVPSHSAATVWFPRGVSGGTVICVEKLPAKPVTSAIGFPSPSSCTDVTWLSTSVHFA
jgi:hypothetical protein